jgi:5'-methylthioadenosine phosphorylase
MDEVFAVFASHTETLKSALSNVVGTLGNDRDCACSRAVDGMDLPIELP